MGIANVVSFERGKMIKIILFAVSCFFISVVSTCESDLDCNLGGICNEVTQSCECAKEWTGDDCGTLALLPAEVDNGFQPPTYSSWGGKIISGTSGEYHMYAALMRGKCGLTTWRDTSEIVHAVSYYKPTGPYYAVPSAEVVRPFTHNPTVEKVSSKAASLYVMAHIGCGYGTVTPQHCFNGTTCEFDGEWHCVEFDDEAENNEHEMQTGCDQPHWVGMQTSSSPSGPWTSVTPADESVVITNPNPTEEPWHNPEGSFTNPSIWPFDNGSILLAYSIGCDDCEISPGHKHVGVSYAETWSGPYIDLTPKEPIFPFATEDPCIFVSPETGTFHILTHATAYDTGEWHGVSAHAFAHDPQGPWTVSDTIPYNETIEWSSGDKTIVEKRERPQVIFLNGVPSLLVNGVAPGKNPSPFSPNGYTGDWSYTHVQAIRT